MQDIRVIRKREFAGGELRKINADYRTTVANKFIELFFEKLQSKRLMVLERLGEKNHEEQSREYWAGYQKALNDIEPFYYSLATEVDELLKAG